MLLERLAVGDVVEVHVHDDLAVEGDAEVPAAAADLLLVPLADGPERAAPGRGDEIDGAVVLGGLELGVFGIGVVEDLRLHAEVGEAARGQRGAQGDAVVAAGFEAELEAKDEVGVFAVGQQVAAAALGAVKDAILNAVTAALAAEELPAVERLAIKQGQKAGFAVEVAQPGSNAAPSDAVPRPRRKSRWEIMI